MVRYYKYNKSKKMRISNGVNKELYIPKFVKIISTRNESGAVKTYRLKVNEKFKPGQFFQVSVLGIGEVPISVSSSPTEKGILELTVRDTGKVTKAMHKLSKNSSLGLRGPYGNFFPAGDMTGRDLVFVAGGIGLAPLRSLIKYVLDNRKKYGHIYLLYGARVQNEMIFKNELKEWQKQKGFDVLLTVDKQTPGWKSNVGVVTTLFDKLGQDLKDYTTVICGPPIMIKYAIQGLLKLGLKGKNIIVTLERYMKCGVGKCGHCYMVDKYVCIDGPVFSYSQLKGLKEVEPLLA